MSDTLTHSQYALCRSLFSAQNRSNNNFQGSKNTKYDFKVCAGTEDLFSREAFLLNCSTAGYDEGTGSSSEVKKGRSEDLPVTIVTTRSKILLRPEPNETGKNGPDNVAMSLKLGHQTE